MTSPTPFTALPRSLAARALRFLERDALVNHPAARALVHEGASVVGIAESGEALVGVAIAGPPMGGEPPLIWLDAIGPVALRRLLATLHHPPRRVLAHRSWMEAVLAREFGPTRARHDIEIFGGEAAAVIGAADPRVRLLTGEALEAMRAHTPSWNLTVLGEHLARGGEAHGIVVEDVLIAHAACGFPVGSVEEITHVYVAPRWRGGGLAQAVTASAIRAIGARGHRPLYRCRVGNLASRRVAERVGLIHVGSVREVAVEASARPAPFPSMSSPIPPVLHTQGRFPAR